MKQPCNTALYYRLSLTMKTLAIASALKPREPFYSSMQGIITSMLWTSILTMDGLVRILTALRFSG